MNGLLPLQWNQSAYNFIFPKDQRGLLLSEACSMVPALRWQMLDVLFTPHFIPSSIISRFWLYFPPSRCDPPNSSAGRENGSEFAGLPRDSALFDVKSCSKSGTLHHIPCPAGAGNVFRPGRGFYGRAGNLFVRTGNAPTPLRRGGRRVFRIM